MSVRALRTFPHDLCSSSKLRRSLRMMRSVEGGVTLIYPLALHGFLKRSHNAVGFLHEFVDQMGTFASFHAWTPFRLLVLPATPTDAARAAVPTLLER